MAAQLGSQQTANNSMLHIAAISEGCSDVETGGARKYKRGFYVRESTWQRCSAGGACLTRCVRRRRKTELHVHDTYSAAFAREDDEYIACLQYRVSTLQRYKRCSVSPACGTHERCMQSAV